MSDQTPEPIQAPQTPPSAAVIAPPVEGTPPPGASPSEAPKGKGFAITALVLGIVALPGALIPFLGLGSAFIGLVGLVFGVIAIIMAMQNKAAGKVMAIVGASLSALAIVVAIATTAAGTKAVDDALDDLGDITTAAPSADSSGPATSSTSEASEPAAVTDVGTIDNPAAIGDGTVWTVSSAGDEWAITFDTVQLADGYSGKVAVVTGTATPTAIADGDVSSWVSFPSIGWMANGAAVDDTFDFVPSDSFSDYRNTLDLEATVGTEMKFYSTVGLPEGVVPDLMTVEALFGDLFDSETMYFATGL